MVCGNVAGFRGPRRTPVFGQWWGSEEVGNWEAAEVHRLNAWMY